jgi:hypothetical protein
MASAPPCQRLLWWSPRDAADASPTALVRRAASTKFVETELFAGLLLR